MTERLLRVDSSISDMDKHQADSWPTTFEGSGLHLTSLDPSHTEAIWPQLQDTRNLRLFRRVYQQDCLSPSALKLLIQQDSEDQSGRHFYAIFKKTASEPVGWMTIYNMLPDTESMEVAFFLPALLRVPIAPRSLHPICVYAFEILGYKTVEYRWAAMTCYKLAGGVSGAGGLTLLGVLERTLFQRQEDASNVYRITDSQWRNVGPALGAWEVSNGIGEASGGTQGMNWII